MQEQGLEELQPRALSWGSDLGAGEARHASDEGAQRPRWPSLRQGYWEASGVVIRPGRGRRFPEDAMAN